MIVLEMLDDLVAFLYRVAYKLGIVKFRDFQEKK